MKKLLLAFGFVLFVVSCGGGGPQAKLIPQDMVIGNSEPDNGATQFGFYWTSSDGTVSLGNDYLVEASNSDGMIVGYNFTTGNLAYWTTATGWTDTNDPGWPVDVSDNGIIVGRPNPTTGDPWYYDTTAANPAMQLIAGGGTVTGINNDGIIIGYTGNIGSSGQSWYYDTTAANPAMVPFGPLANGSWSVAQGINNNGMIVGIGNGDGCNGMNGCGWHYDLNTSTMTAIAAPTNATDMQWLRVNDNDWIVGTSNVVGASATAWYWLKTTQTFTFLPGLVGHNGSVANAVSNSNVVVGWTFDDATSMHHAFWWDDTEVELNLIPGMGDFSSANDIGRKIP